MQKYNFKLITPLRLMLKHIELVDKLGGLCAMPGQFMHMGLINELQRDKLQDFLSEHFNIMEYYWKIGVVAPRKEWVEEQINIYLNGQRKN